MLERKPDQILIKALIGMLPKNNLRHDIIKQNLILFNEPFHTYSNILPQFTEILPRDINEDLGLDNITKDSHIVNYMSTSELPEELKELELDIDETMDVPETIKKKTHN